MCTCKCNWDVRYISHCDGCQVACMPVNVNLLWCDDIALIIQLHTPRVQYLLSIILVMHVHSMGPCMYYHVIVNIPI